MTNPPRKTHVPPARGKRHPKTPLPLTDLQAIDLKRVCRYLPTVMRVFQASYEGKSKVAAIKAKCIECCNLDRRMVAECNIEGCPLWRFRPYQAKQAQNGQNGRAG